jgi:hypothetical protein
MSELPKVLFRNTELEYAKAFVEEGEIMFRSLSFYRYIEDPARRDENDGVWIKNGPVKSAKLTFIKLPVEHEPRGVPIDLQDIGDVKISVGDPEPVSRVISSYSIERQLQFGSATVEIFDVASFLSKVENALRNDRLDLSFGHVEYYNFDSHLPEPCRLWLQKDAAKFSCEKEYRLGYSIPFNRVVGSHLWSKQQVPIEMSVQVVCGSLQDCAKIVTI